MRFHCTAAAAAVFLAAAGTAAGQAPSPAPGDATFGVFLQGTQLGREQVNVASAPSGWIITSSGATLPPLDFTVGRFEMKYAPDWQPLELTLEGHTRNTAILLRTSFGLTTAINEITQNSRTVSKEDQITAKSIVLPNNVFGAYEALAARLWGAAPDTELPVYVVPQAEVKIKVRAVADQTLSGPSGSLATRRFDLTFQNADRPVNAVVTVDTRLRLVRVEIPDVGLLVVREDASSVAMRPVTIRNPTDADVRIPANGFNLAATVTTPPAVAGRLRHPAVILVGGITPADRDHVIDGVPVFAQVAGALADAGVTVLRYDRRGAGQSGGRTESAAIADYADDVAAAVRWLSRRGDVDKNRIAIAGYGDGAAVALLAAAKVKEIDGVITLNAAGSRGADLILEQQQRVLDALKLPPDDRQARIDLQRRIVAAAGGKGSWEGVPDVMRRQADTPWFRSVLQFDPADVLPKVRQPILIVHGERDASIPSAEAERLAALANARKKAAPAVVVHVRGATHALVDESGKIVSPRVAAAIADWVKKL